MFTITHSLPASLLFLVFLGGVQPVLHAEEIPETDNAALFIESKTAVASAQCVIAGGDEDDDKKRTDVGIGEEVELTLTGKRLNDIDLDSIEWTMEPDHLATIKKSREEKNIATLTINKDITDNTTVTVQVKTNLDEEQPERKPLILNIFIPSHITAEHAGERIPACAADQEKTTREHPPSWL